MNKLSRHNLQEFCRICLSNLRALSSSAITINRDEIIYDLSEDDVDEEYPKSLCQLCYDKMIDIQDFHKVALKSAELCYNIIHETGISGELIDHNAQKLPSFSGLKRDTIISKELNTKAYNTMDDQDDDQLLLPELAPLLDRSIKAEPIDIEDPRPQTPYTENAGLHSGIKNEIDSEFEDDNSTFYENNALGTTYDSIGDDADDEEHALRSGAANASTTSTTSTIGRQRVSNGPLRKRDRNKKSLKCPRCDKQVYKQVYLDAHIRGVHEGHDKPFLCLECEKAFTRYNQLHVHIQAQHFLEQKFSCDFDGCEATFKMSNTLDTHREVVHTASDAPFSIGLQEALELHQQQLSREIEMDHICQQCFKKYSSKRALSEHLKRHAQIKVHVCNVCNVAKVTRTELQTHMRTHEPNLEKFKCSICPQQFKHKNAITRHIRVVHEGQRRFPCSFCSKRFGTRNSQVCHERLHTGERPYNCKVCEKGFAQMEGLKSHMKNHDKQLRKHICSFCSQRFITRKNLITHEQRHLGDKPHICNVCSRGFFKQEDLEVHIRAHVEEDGSDEHNDSDNPLN